MINFDPEIRIDSATPGFEGVSFNIHQLTEGKRIQIRTMLAKTNMRLREALAEKAQLTDKEGFDAQRIADDLSSIWDDEMNPAWVRAMLVSMDGILIKGQPVTPDSLISSGPRELYQEVVNEIHKNAGLTERQRGESAPLTTSSAQADGRTNSSSAPDAVSAATT